MWCVVDLFVGVVVVLYDVVLLCVCVSGVVVFVGLLCSDVVFSVVA